MNGELEEQTRIMTPEQVAMSAYAERIDFDLSGTSAGPYRLEHILGRGGGGTVYRARHESGELVAVKVLLPQAGAGTELLLRFSREIKTLQELRHPNIVRVIDSGSVGKNWPFFAMELLEGITLRQLLDRHRRLSPEECLDVVRPISAALSAAHSVGIVHRDLKASNIFLAGEPPVLKLLDFGVAKFIQPDEDSLNLTTFGTQIGTIDSMAPEQIRCTPVDARTDVYALGVLLYQMLTGHLPFHGVTPEELMQAHLSEPPPRPSWVVPISSAVDDVVLKCLQKLPERRFDSMAAACDAFVSAVLGSPTAISGAARERPSLAVFVEVVERAGESDDAFDDAVLGVLDEITEMLEGLGFRVALELGSSVVAIDDEERLEGLGDIPRRLEAFERELDAPVALRMVLHAAGVQCDQGQLVGGDLAQLETWTAAENHAVGLRLTPEAARFLAHESRTRSERRA